MSNETDIAIDMVESLSDTASYAIDCGGESRLLADIEVENNISRIINHRIVPSAAAIHSLFSENNLLLD